MWFYKDDQVHEQSESLWFLLPLGLDTQTDLTLTDYLLADQDEIRNIYKIDFSRNVASDFQKYQQVFFMDLV